MFCIQSSCIAYIKHIDMYESTHTHTHAVNKQFAMLSCHFSRIESMILIIPLYPKILLCSLIRVVVYAMTMWHRICVHLQNAITRFLLRSQHHALSPSFQTCNPSDSTLRMLELDHANTNGNIFNFNHYLIVYMSLSVIAKNPFFFNFQFHDFSTSLWTCYGSIRVNIHIPISIRCTHKTTQTNDFF